MSLDDLQAQLRGALDEQFAALKSHQEHAIAEARRQAQADAEHEMQAKLVAARAEWEERLNAQVAAVRADVEHAAGQREEQIRAEFDQAREQASAAARRSAELEFESERRRAQRELELERERSKMNFEAHAQLERELGALRQAAAQHAAAAAAAAGEATAAKAEATAAKAEATAAKADAAAAQAKAAAVAQQPVPKADASSSGRYDQVASGIRTLDDAQTLGQAIDALVAHAAAIAGRAALFLVNGDRLKAWRASGIPDVDVQTVESSITGRDLLARAIQAGRPEAANGSVSAPPFARLPVDRAALAVPVMIGGRAVAVLYADGGPDGTVPSEWQGAVDLLARHASALLALRTALRTFDMLRGVPDGAPGGDAGDGGEEGARRYARLLVSEIKLYNEGAVRVGRQKRDLHQRLQEEITRARRLYEERVPAAVSARASYFQQELVQTLADGDASLLGN